MLNSIGDLRIALAASGVYTPDAASVRVAKSFLADLAEASKI